MTSFADYLRVESRKRDDPELPLEQRGVNFFVDCDEEAMQIPVSFNLRYVSLYDLIQFFCMRTGVEMRIQGVIVFLTQRKDTKFIRRAYNCNRPSVFMDNLSSEGIKEFFVRNGVAFPEGSGLSYLPELGKIFVFNTSENLGDFECVLEDIYVSDNQIVVECRVLLADKPDAGLADLNISTADILELIDDSEILFVGTASVISGHSAEMRMGGPAAVIKKNLSVSSQTWMKIAPYGHVNQQEITLPFSLSINLDIGKEGHFTYSNTTTINLYHKSSRAFWVSPPPEVDLDDKQIAIVVSARFIDPAGRTVEQSDSSSILKQFEE